MFRFKGVRDENQFTAFMRIEILDQFVMNLDASMNFLNLRKSNDCLIFLKHNEFAILFSRHRIENVAFYLLAKNFKYCAF